MNKLDIADWLRIDQHRAHEIALKRELLATKRDTVFAQIPKAEPAARELLAVLIDHLPRFHGELFEAIPNGVRDRATGEEVYADAPEPLIAAGLLVQDDFLLLSRNEHDKYVLEGAFLCMPTRWRLQEKFQRPLAEIHEYVPGYAERLQNPMDRLFLSLQPERPVWRANWGFTDDPALYQPYPRSEPITLEADKLGQQLYLRVERQTLRRLPESHFVLFSIRVYAVPMDDVVEVPGAMAALAARLREIPEPMLRYKRLVGDTFPLILNWLDERAAAEAALSLSTEQPAAMVG